MYRGGLRNQAGRVPGRPVRRLARDCRGGPQVPHCRAYTLSKGINQNSEARTS